MSNRSTFVFCVLLVAATVASTSQEVVVLMKSREIPTALKALSARYAIVPGLFGKQADNTQQSPRLRALADRLRRYARVWLDNPSVTLDSIRAIPGVESAWTAATVKLHEDELLPLTQDSLSADQYALRLIGAARAWEYSSGNGVIVGVIDTGIDWDHEDLRDALAVRSAEDINGSGHFEAWPSEQQINGLFGDLNGVDDDDNGMVDDVIGADFVDQEVRNIGDDRRFDAVPFDEHGHGTLVSGVIAATKDNRKGIAGLAWGSRICAIRAFDATGNAEEANIASAIVYAAAMKVNVLNMSFGDVTDSPLMRDAVAYAQEGGCVLIASAGNSGAVSRQYPASYSGVIVVGSTNAYDLRSPFSSTGALLTCSAPGQTIVTTAVGSRYRTVSGTSFSAPYVSATAALLLQRHPTITAEEIRGTLMATSVDLGEPGWDLLYGSGRIRADEAMLVSGFSRIEITNPANETEIDVRRQSSIDIVGSNHMIAFQTSSLHYGKGLEPATWNLITSGKQSVVGGLLGKWDVRDLSAGLYILRLRVSGGDSRAHDVYARVRLVDGDTCSIVSTECLPAWYSERSTNVVTVRTSRPTTCVIRNAGVDGADLASTPRAITTLHSIVLPDTAAATDANRPIIIECSPFDGRSATTNSALSSTNQAIPTTGWAQTQLAPWAGYVLNDVRDLYREGLPCVVMNDFEAGGFGRIAVRQYADGAWRTRDSLESVYIPRAITDINGNGLYEVLCHVIGKTVLFEQSSPTSSMFETILFADTTSVVNAAGAADIDGDGREEILALADDACFVFTCKNGSVSLLGKASNTSPFPQGVTSNRVDEISVAAGDFDGNGKMEIAFADTDGDLVVHEWTGSNFEQRFLFESQGAGGSGYVAAGDVNHDGRPDLLFGVPDSIEANSQGEFGRRVWTYHLFSASRDSGFSEVWTQHVAGVRYGIGYRNGVDLRNVDGLPGAEIIIGAFPRLYVFGRGSSDTIIPKYFSESVASPRFLTFDFDNNGMPELGFGATVDEVGAMLSFRFIESNIGPVGASSLRASYKRSDTSWGRVRLTWYPLRDARSYLVYRNTGNGDSVVGNVMQGTSPQFEYVVRGRVDTALSFVVRAIALDTTKPLGPSSNRAAVNLMAESAIIRPEQSTISRRTLLRGLNCTLRSSIDLSFREISLAKQQLISSDGNTLIGKARYARSIGDRALQLAFPAIAQYQGDSILLTVDVQFSGNLGISRSFFLKIIDTPEPAPSKASITLSGVEVSSPTLLLVHFSHEVDQSALSVQSYDLTPIGKISVTRRVSPNSIELELDAAQPLEPRGIMYTIRARDITFDTTHAIAKGAGSALSFRVLGSGDDDVYAYPQPLSLNKHDYLVFAGLPARADVEVLDESMKQVALLRGVDGTGGLRWDIRSSLSTIEPGVLFYTVTDRTPERNGTVWPLKKLLIQR